MKKPYAKATRYLWIISAILFASAIALYSYYQYIAWIGAHAYIAVVNDTTNSIVWVGSGGACVPYAPNTRLVYGCTQSSAGSYTCGRVTYNLSSKMISC